MRERLRSLLGSATSLRGELIRGAAGSMAVRAARMLLSLALAILLARHLGAKGYGTYTYAFAMVSLLAVPTQLGLPTVVVRETARCLAAAEWPLMRGLWRWTAAAIVVLSVSITGVGIGVVCALGQRLSPLQSATLTWGFVLIPVMALANVPGAALRGLGHVVLGQIPETVLQPGLFVLLVLGAGAACSASGLSAADAMALQVLAAALSLAVGLWLLRRNPPRELLSTSGADYRASNWASAAMSLALVAGMGLINQYTDVIMLGLLRTSEEVGTYRVAVSGAALVAFGLGAITTMASPYFARFHYSGERARLQRVVIGSSRAILGLTAPIVLAFVCGGERIITLLFGPEYIGAHTALAILSTGQLVSALLGPVGALLMMTGHEREALRGMAVGAGVNVLLNLLLVPIWGINGAAVATAFSIAVWNCLLWRSVRETLHIHTTAVRLCRRGFD